MDVQIPQEQQAIVEGLVAAGRFSSVQEAISEGIRLLASNEKLRQEFKSGSTKRTVVSCMTTIRCSHN